METVNDGLRMDVFFFKALYSSKSALYSSVQTGALKAKKMVSFQVVSLWCPWKFGSQTQCKCIIHSSEPSAQEEPGLTPTSQILHTVTCKNQLARSRHQKTTKEEDGRTLRTEETWMGDRDPSALPRAIPLQVELVHGRHSEQDGAQRVYTVLPGCYCLLKGCFT